MFALSEQMHYYLCHRTIRMSNGINGLYTIIKNELHRSPVSGDVFVFFSRNHQAVKLLKWDGDGFILYHKRLERGTFEVPEYKPEEDRFEMPWRTFNLIMSGVSIKSARFRRRFRIEA